MTKSIIITVDTEGDNLWAWKPGKEIKTNNSSFIEPFQEVCEKYRFYPVYLTNYEMATSDEFVAFGKEKSKDNLCEIGMHLHAWNSPPDYELNGEYGGNPYITEYPIGVIREKHKYLYNLIYEKFGVKPVSYRAGRWATSQDLFKVLDELHIKVDCSFTPGINHNIPGKTVRFANDYRSVRKDAFFVTENLLEVPMTSRASRSINGDNMRRKIANLVKGERIWLRPALQTKEEMCRLINLVVDEGTDYLMFMIHSSELMPGGSPYCRTQADVDSLLEKLDETFSYVSEFGKGILLRDYYCMMERKVK